MTSTLRRLRTVLSIVLAAAVLQLGALVASTTAEANTTTVTATTWVNIRSGPGTNYSKLGVLDEGKSLEQVGKSGVWAKVKYKGGFAWIHSAYLSTKIVGATPISSGGSTGVRYSTGELNVRSGPALTSTVITTVKRGTPFALTGRTSNGFSEVNVSGTNRWVYTAYLTSAAPSVSLPKTTGKVRLTGLLMIRSNDTANFTVFGKAPKGTVVDATGVRRNGVVQAVYQGRVVWFDAAWVAAVSGNTGPSVPAAPKSIGTRTSSSNLNVRAQANSGSALLATARAGTVFSITGAVSNGYAQIVWNGRSAWVSANPLVATSGSLVTAWSSGLDSLLPNAKGIVRTVKQQFPRIQVMYGIRFATTPDHPAGKAVDIMLPNYKAERAFGWQIAKYMQANAKRLNIRYIIFAQQVWNVEYADRGWRLMADRGDPTANHYDHVHVTTY